jgi:hypothetical protein
MRESNRFLDEARRVEKRGRVRRRMDRKNNDAEEGV